MTRSHAAVLMTLLLVTGTFAPATAAPVTETTSVGGGTATEAADLSRPGGDVAFAGQRRGGRSDRDRDGGRGARRGGDRDGDRNDRDRDRDARDRDRDRGDRDRDRGDRGRDDRRSDRGASDDRDRDGHGERSRDRGGPDRSDDRDGRDRGRDHDRSPAKADDGRPAEPDDRGPPADRGGPPADKPEPSAGEGDEAAPPTRPACVNATATPDRGPRAAEAGERGEEPPCESGPPARNRTPAAVNRTESALELRVTAWRHLAEQPTAEERRRSLSAREAAKLREELNESFRGFVGFHRIDDVAVMADDKEVAARAGKRAPNVTANLLVADEKLARTALADAERTYARLEARGDERRDWKSDDVGGLRSDPDGDDEPEAADRAGDSSRSTFRDSDDDRGVVPQRDRDDHEGRWGDDRDERWHDDLDEDEVERELAKARRAMKRAEHVRSKGGHAAAAMAHYRRAWVHAQRALDVMDAATDPQVTITERSDPAHDGTINYTVHGRVFDVRPWQVGNVTVWVDGNRTTTAPVFARNATPGQTWGFAARVRLSEPVNRIAVTATDSGEFTTRRRKDFEPNTGEARLFLDGDRLPDRYELANTTTDPLDPDSNATATNATEGADSVDDGAADLDSDRLANVEERRLGTDPLVADTDADNLTDSFEVFLADTDPLVADTDGNGTVDGAEDPDGDGLTNAEEEAFGSDPLVADSDADGLDDAEERRLGTEPLVFDTDGDGLGDARELEAPFHTDPLDPDTDDDGVRDGAETYTTTVRNESVGATVAVTGTGDVSAAMDVRSDPHAFLNNSGTRVAGVSARVAVESTRRFRTAEVSLSYDGSAASDESDVSIYRYNRTLQTFVRLPSTVDPANDTVRANTSETGTYVAFENDAWQSLFEDPLPANYSYRVGEFSSGNVSCSGTGECSVVGGTIRVGTLDASVSSFGGIEILGEAGGDEDADACDYEGSAGYDSPNCPGSPGGNGGDDGPEDSDNDGINDNDDDCPNASGPSSTDGCPDRDGDGTRDSDDWCPDDPAKTEPACFESTASGATVTFPDDADEIEVEVDVRADVDNSDGYVEVWLEYDGGREMLYSQHGPGGTFGVDTIREDVSHLRGETVTLKIKKGDDATGDLEDFRTFIDTDGEGLWDNEEQEGFRMGTGETVYTHVNEEDTDHDDLEDSDEVLKRTSYYGTYYEYTYFLVRTDPTAPDTDFDGVGDYDEVNGWEQDVYEQTVTVDGETYTGPYRWKSEDGTQNAEVDVDSDPWDADTDNDGLRDGDERDVYHTLADEQVSYSVTEIRQDRIVDRMERAYERNPYSTGLQVVRSARNLRLIDGGPDELQSLELTDATDDFDFVTRDDGGLVFRSIDRKQRTDTWLSNVEEVRAGIDMRDPDSDDDGLTDGQEIHWVTEGDPSTLASIEQDFEPGTDPEDPDTDGDGYWDGWIGVHGVGETENVVLYMEHLNDSGGVSGNEVVPEQAGVHSVADSPSATGATIPGFRDEMHSNLHVGELQWETDPADRRDSPSPSFTLEVDFYEDASYGSLAEQSWASGIEENYALYGVEVDVIQDETLNNSDFDLCTVYDLLDASIRDDIFCVYPDNGFGYREIVSIAANNHSTGADEYVVVLDRAGGAIPDGANQSGVNLFAYPYQAIFTKGMANDVPFVPTAARRNSPYSDRLAMLSAKTEIHEIGHSFGTGEADDTSLIEDPHRKFRNDGEIYSGANDPEDPTPEDLTVTGNDGWSIMRAGWSRQLVDYPMNGRYFAYSIEELSTIGES